MNQKLTLNEMADRLKVTPKTLKKYVFEYQIPHIGIGRLMRFDAVKVETYLEHLEKEKTAKVEIKSFTPKRKISLNPINSNKSRYENLLK
jgi:excisionase family DNA binding protein